MGLKLLLVCFLALIMAIPALFVFGLLGERTQRAKDVTQEIGGLMGGEQAFMGPVLAVPYTLPPAAKDQQPVRAVYLIFPTRAEGQVATRTQLRQRSLFKVPVYRSDMTLHSTFDLAGAGAAAPQGANLDWSRTEFLVGVSDARGAQSDAVLSAGGHVLTLSPATTLGDFSDQPEPANPQAPPRALRFFGVSAAALATPGARFEASTSLRFTGAQRIAFVAWGKTTDLTVTGDWPSPSFDGGLLPTARAVTAHGFTAHWTVPYVARGVPAEGASDGLGRLLQTALGVTFVEPANPYQSVERSLKYALLFVSLVFLTFFIFETTTGRKVHPAQYILVGLAQIVFYLLLLSIAEQIGFDLAFLAAASATVGLISAYAGWVFESRRQGVVALIAFSALYALIYVLMRLEDFALLVGAVASFSAIAAVMYFTRRIDWYGVIPTPAAPTGSKEHA
jgi:inner membrane protein